MFRFYAENVCKQSFQHNLHFSRGKNGTMKSCTYLSMWLNQGTLSELYGRASRAGIQRHCFTAPAQLQDDRDNGSFFLKPLTTKYRQHTQETTTLPKAPLFHSLSSYDHRLFIFLTQGDSHYNHFHSPRN